VLRRREARRDICGGSGWLGCCDMWWRVLPFFDRSVVAPLQFVCCRILGYSLDSGSSQSRPSSSLYFHAKAPQTWLWWEFTMILVTVAAMQAYWSCWHPRSANGSSLQSASALNNFEVSLLSLLLALFEHLSIRARMLHIREVYKITCHVYIHGSHVRAYL
jgi:hypothetical protein